MQANTNLWILTDIRTVLNGQHGVTSHGLTWVNSRSQEQIKTWVDETMENYAYWHGIVENKQYGYYTNIHPAKRKTKDGLTQTVANADYKPELKELIANSLLAKNYARNGKPDEPVVIHTNTMFNQLFDTE